jgi:hypothetical protein
MKMTVMKVRVKRNDHRPGVRVPTAKPSIRHKSIKDYNRKVQKKVRVED